MTETLEDLVRAVARATQATAAFDAELRCIAASPKWLADRESTEPVSGGSGCEAVAEVGVDREAADRRCSAGATGRRFEPARAGSRRLAWEVRPWRDGSGAIGGIVIASRAVTDRVEARARSAERLEAPIEASLSEEARRVVGARIASVRFRLDRTERDFARLVGVPRAAVSAWEKGQGLARDDLRLIAERTDTAYEWLAEGLTGEPPAARREEGASKPGDSGHIRPQRLLVGGELPKAITSVWKLRREGMADAAGSELDTIGDRPSALFLGLPGASLCSGARAPGYGMDKSRYRSAQAELLLNFTFEGRCRVEQMGREFDGAEGSAVFSSSFEGGRYSYQSGGRYLSVAVPATALQTRIRDVEQRLMQPIAPDSPPLRLLSAYVSALMKSDAGLEREVARSVADHLVDLCALLLGARGDERALAETRGLRAAQRSVIHEAIDAGAATPGFSAQAVAAQLGVSPRYVHFLLEEGGAGFGSLVTARRLAVVRERLADPKFDRMTIPEVATACGFADLQRFQLQFVARFGGSPSAFRARR